MNPLDGIVDDNVLKIFTLFLKNPDRLYHINKAAKDSKVPLATAFRIIKRLSKSGFIEQVKISKFKIYRLAKNAKIDKIRGIL